MTVRTVCVAPGQLLREGERVAELLEPSGRWVCLIASQAAGKIKAVRIRAGFFVGRQLPGRHVTRIVRRITYLDADHGVGAFIRTKSQVQGTFSYADARE